MSVSSESSGTNRFGCHGIPQGLPLKLGCAITMPVLRVDRRGVLNASFHRAIERLRIDPHWMAERYTRSDAADSFAKCGNSLCEYRKHTSLPFSLLGRPTHGLKVTWDGV